MEALGEALSGLRRIPIVGVMGSGEHAHEDRAAPLGRALAGLGVHLLTGGGRGVMTAVSRAFCQVERRRGLSIGVLPGDLDSDRRSPPDGYPNPWIELPVYTHLPLSGAGGTGPMSRNHVNVLTADVVVALSGSLGTSSEVKLSLGYRRPLVAFLRSRDEIPELPGRVRVLADLDAVLGFVRDALEAQGWTLESREAREVDSATS